MTNEADERYTLDHTLSYKSQPRRHEPRTFPKWRFIGERRLDPVEVLAFADRIHSYLAMGLLRYQVFLAYGGAFLAVWYSALLRKGEILSLVASQHEALATVVLDWAPVLALFVFALYALARLIVGVMTFGDCPAAAAELEMQVAEAKKELKKRGIL